MCAGVDCRRHPLEVTSRVGAAPGAGGMDHCSLLSLRAEAGMSWTTSEAAAAAGVVVRTCVVAGTELRSDLRWCETWSGQGRWLWRRSGASR